MFTIEMLPAQNGDAVWLEYGTPSDVRRILIDGGTPPTGRVLADRIRQLAPGDRVFELLLVTHVDVDHIGGVLPLLADTTLGVTFRDVWFNDWAALPPCPTPRRGPIDGAILTGILDRYALSTNAAFGGAAVCVPPYGELPAVDLDGGLRLTLLAPVQDQLAALTCVWNRVLQGAGLDPAGPDPDRLAEKARRKGVSIPRSTGPLDVDTLARRPFAPDRGPANGSSIVVLAEYAGRSCLLAGDAHADVLTASLRRLAYARGAAILEIDAMKLPHHGSRRNVSTPLLSATRCSTFLFSTDGSVHGHPDPEAVARIISHHGPGTTLLFNYRHPQAEQWDAPALRARYGYAVRWPDPGGTGMVLDLS